MDEPIERLKEIVLRLTGLLEERDAEIERLKKRLEVTPADKPDPAKPKTRRV